MAKNLVIVESPAKAKTIEGFLGKDFKVSSSFGHVRDLAVNQISIDVTNDYQPNYEVPADKKKIVDALKKEVKVAETVWLASDEDREGEAIAWHLYETLNLEEKNSKRIVFHEITKTAITEAIKHPRSIDTNLVDAQQARRILDRLVGYELSPVLWRKVKPSLSAGRVQSVAVRLIVDRETEIKKHEAQTWFRVTAEFLVENANGKGIMNAEVSERFPSREAAFDFLNKCVDSSFSVKSIEKKPAKKTPAPPFTTSTLQQEASRKMGYSVAKTMMVAQQLYEQGKITYMRTDSVNLSNLVLDASKKEITASYGEKYVKTRRFSTKTKGAQEAHEAIRPTYINNHTVEGTNDQKRLYALIWKRTIASQMSDALLERTNIAVDVSKAEKKFVARGEVIKFDGFLKVYLESTDDENAETPKGVLPALTVGEMLSVEKIESSQRFSSPAARYTEASLVKKMEELGIGRPSTYAPTISTIQKRGYVVKEDRQGKEREFIYMILTNGAVKETVKKESFGNEKSKLFPTDIGSIVNKFLIENFVNIMDFNFTASVEKKFDNIASGNISWSGMIDDFYKPFHDTVEVVIETAERVKGERILGKDPQTGKPVIARLGRFGPMIQLGDSENGEGEKPRFAGLKKEQSIETITLEEALSQLQFPRLIGTFEDEDVSIGIGRFGPYVKHDKKFYSLAKTDDPSTVELERSIVVIREKREADSKKLIKEFVDEKIRVSNGRYGPYITSKGKNYKIPKEVDPEGLTLEDCQELIEKGGKKGGAAPKGKAKSKPKAKAKAKPKPKAKPKAKK